MEFNILYAIQAMYSSFLDNIILAITKVMGNYGQIWLLVSLALLIPKKTRKAGVCIISSYILVFLLGQFALKDLIARPRPCHIDETVTLLVKRPGSYSCPSTHTAWAFAGATSIYCYHKRAGIAVGVIAIIIGFSRLYLFVHFPTDVLIGAVMGIVLAIICAVGINRISDKIAKAKQ